MIYLCRKVYGSYDSQPNQFKISSKSLNKRTLEDSGDGSMTKYHKVLGEVINVTSTIRSFRPKKHAFATIEQTKKELSYLYPS